MTEAAQAGYALTGLICDTANYSAGSDSVSLTLLAGDNVTCTFVNTRSAGNGSVTIVKEIVADPGPGGNPDQAFSFFGDLGSFTLDDNVDATFPNTRTFLAAPGSHVVSEFATPGWDLTGLGCDSANTSPDVPTATVSITLAAGDAVTCTFTNTEQAHGSITVAKNASPDSEQDFSFFGPTGPFMLDDDVDAALPNSMTFDGLVAGQYFVGEVLGTPNWDLTGITCTPGATVDLVQGVALVDLVAGADVTCTFTNSERAVNQGSITIIKETWCRTTGRTSRSRARWARHARRRHRPGVLEREDRDGLGSRRLHGDGNAGRRMARDRHHVQQRAERRMLRAAR